MNLIEKLGIEKARAIIDGAPRGAEKWRDMDSVCHPNEILYYAKGPHFWVVWDVEKSCWVVSIIHDDSEYILDQLQDLRDLRTAIANPEKCQHDWNETTSNGDAYRFFVCKHCDSTRNYVPFEDDNPSHFDHCSDIKNHLSPLTGVIEG